jgi:hypothetical protein
LTAEANRTRLALRLALPAQGFFRSARPCLGRRVLAGADPFRNNGVARRGDGRNAAVVSDMAAHSIEALRRSFARERYLRPMKDGLAPHICEIVARR